LRTRRHAVWLGIAAFSVTTLVLYALGVLFGLGNRGLIEGIGQVTGAYPITGKSFFRLLRSFAACLPLSILIGMLAGLDAYRYAVGARMLVGPLVLLVFAVPFLSAESGTFSGVLIGVMIFSTFQWFHRFAMAGHGGLRYVAFLMVYSLVLLPAVLFVGAYRLGDALAEVSAIGLLYSDALVVGWVNLWARGGMLDVTQGGRLQFSLRSMLLLFAAWGLYLTLLATMFSERLR
jgi:hypothetical protein